MTTTMLKISDPNRWNILHFFILVYSIKVIIP